MAAKPTHDLAVKTGEYTDRQTGQVKGRWLRVGTVLRHDDGGTSIKLDAVPVGLPEWTGWINVFPRDQQGQGGQGGNGGQSAQRGPAGAPAPATAEDLDDDIPF